MPTVQIEESLHEALKETDLLAFQHKLAVEKQLTKVEHFDHVTDEELASYGLSAPAIRRLRNALDRRKKAKKSKLFSKPKPARFINADFETPPESSVPSTSASTSKAPCLIAREDVQLMENLGQGTFATVKRAVWQRSGSLIKVDCAVKILHNMSEQAVDDLHAEIAHMQKLKHQNVVQLYGISVGEPTMMVIEYCDGGSLLNRLRNTKKPVLLVTKLLSYALQIASGMAYLENRRVVHRDLATRNILLTDNEEVIKICDFGLTRSLEENERLYIMSAQKKVAFSWCPPESLRFRQFSHKSDCWAFGVTLWELYTYGEEPWAGHRAADVLRLTEGGEQLKKPRKCLDEIYKIAQMCWNLQADLRPKFSHLRNLLLDVKFMTAETRESFISEEPDTLELSVGDHVIIISEHAQEWYGQCVSSRKFGKFPYRLVSVKSHRVSNAPNNGSNAVSSPSALAAMSSSNGYRFSSQQHISKPVPGSLIHTGHGDIDQDKCWGNVGHIDEIYLKNPVIRPSDAESRSHGVSFISSITALHDDILSTPGVSAKVRPISTNPIKLDFDPLKAWDLPTVPEVLVPKPAPVPSAKPPPVNAKPTISPDVFNSLKTEYEKWDKIKSTEKKYDTSTAVPRPTHSSTSQSADLTNTINATTNDPIVHRRNQTQPVVLPENDPFVVDPNLKNLTLKQEPIPWRQMTAEPRPPAQIPRPQSARLNNSFNFDPKPAPLDQSVLALLDPLAKAPAVVAQPLVPRPQSTGHFNTLNAQTTKKTEPIASIASVPRPQTANNVPSALNVLAFVTNGQKVNVPPASAWPTSSSQPPKKIVPATAPPSNNKPMSSTPITNKPVPSSSTKRVVPATAPPSNKVISTSSVSSLLPPPSELAVPKVPATTASSLLPPPSDLLLSGLKKEAATSSRNGDSAYGSLTSNSSVSKLTLNTSLANDNKPHQLFNIQHSPIENISTPSNYYFPPQQQPNVPSMIYTQNNQQLFYSPSGIPYLMPTPLQPTTARAIPQPSTSQPMVISLNDLDTDKMISHVKSKADFATAAQCAKALRESGYEVNEAVQYLKVEQLIEMKLCKDRNSAVSALVKTDWDLNEAAIQLLS